jgi:hypothetical protein
MTEDRRNLYFAIGGLTLAVALGLAWFQYSAPSNPSSAPATNPNSAHGIPAPGILPGVREVNDIFDPSKPLFVDQSEPTTLSNAVSKAKFAVPLPQYVPPGVEAQPEVWYSGQTGEVGLRYGDRLVVDYAPWNSDQTPSEEYPNMVKQWGTGKATAINGYPAWVIPAGSPNTVDPSISEIYIGMNGVEVNLSGLVSSDELLKVAESIPPAK